MTPPPVFTHQYFSSKLCSALEAMCPPKFVIVAGVEVRISKTRTFIPDAVAVTRQAAARHPARFHPSEVTLAVEIVSPGSVSIDRVLKPALYAAAGITSYWRVEPTEDYRLYAGSLAPGAAVYTSDGEFDDVVELTRPWPLRFDLTTLRDALQL